MALPGDLTGPIELALARSATQLPGQAAGPGSCWRYELKWDGYRAVIIREGRRTRIWSRQGKGLSDRFPDILTTIAAQISGDCVIDGELVVWDQDRLSFGALQQRPGCDFLPGVVRVRTGR